MVFVIDRGSATHDSFEYMKMACLNAIDSFRPDQKYQIVFWKLDKDKDPVVIPKSPHPGGQQGGVGENRQGRSMTSPASGRVI